MCKFKTLEKISKCDCVCIYICKFCLNFPNYCSFLAEFAFSYGLTYDSSIRMETLAHHEPRYFHYFALPTINVQVGRPHTHLRFETLNYRYL